MKAQPGVDHQFRAFVRAFGCEVAQKYQHSDWCGGIREFAHTNHRKMGGTHVPDVGNGVCLCTKHHTGEIHVIGPETFARKYELDLEGRAAEYAKRYRDGTPFLEDV